LDDALFEGAKVVQEAAIARAPKRSGRLKRGIYAASFTKSNYKKVGKTNRGIKPKRGTAIIASGTWYGRLLEYGTKKMAAKPFLRPALDEAKDKAIETTVEYLRKKLDSQDAK